MTMSPIQPVRKAPYAAYWATGTFLFLLPLMLFVFLQLVPPAVWNSGHDDWLHLSFTGGANLLEESRLPPAGMLGWFSSPWDYLSGLWPFLRQPRVGLPVALHILTAISIAAALSGEVLRRVREQGAIDILAEHVRGPRAIWGEAGRAWLAASWRRDLRRSGSGVELAPGLNLPTQLETEGVFLAGRPGSGKSVLLEGVADQALARGGRLVALDVKGQLANRLKDHNPWILSLSGANCAVWHIGSDLIDDADADEFAASLIPASRDPVWSEGSRLILSAMIMALHDRHGTAWGWVELDRTLSLPVDKLEPIIFDYAPSIARLLNAREEPASFVLSLVFNLASHVCSTVRRFASLEKAGVNRLSLREWARPTKGRRRPIVLHHDLQRRERSAALVRLALRVLSGVLLGRELPDGIDTDTWILLDEVTRIGQCESIADLASLGRSRGVRTVLTVQSPAQLVETYGAAGAEALRENFGTQIICAMPPGDNALRVSKDWIGDRIVREPAGQVEPGKKPQEWTMPALSPQEIAGELGVKSDLWGRIRIRAAILSGGNVAVLDWPLHRWRRLGAKPGV